MACLNNPSASGNRVKSLNFGSETEPRPQMCFPLGWFRHRWYLGAATGALGAKPPFFFVFFFSPQERKSPRWDPGGKAMTEAGGQEGCHKSITSVKASKAQRLWPLSPSLFCRVFLLSGFSRHHSTLHPPPKSPGGGVTLQRASVSPLQKVPWEHDWPLKNSHVLIPHFSREQSGHLWFFPPVSGGLG